MRMRTKRRARFSLDVAVWVECNVVYTHRSDYSKVGQSVLGTYSLTTAAVTWIHATQGCHVIGALLLNVA